MNIKIKTEVWLYPGMAGWHFATIGEKQATKIKEKFGKNRRGFGSVPVSVKIGKTSWKTSIFPDKSGVYVLPIKALIRKKEGIFEGDFASISLKIG